MCGFLITTSNFDKAFSEIYNSSFSAIQYRGPDDSKKLKLPRGMMGFHRLSIMDTTNAGNQPFTSKNSPISLVCNGEIYNYQQHYKDHKESYDFTSYSDCEVILPLYIEHGIQGLLNLIDGEYAFVIYDHDKDDFIAARDPMGIRPLFYGTHQDGTVHFASEAKALIDFCSEVAPFPPGYYYQGGQFFSFLDLCKSPTHNDSIDDVLKNIHDLFSDAVIKRLNSDAPVGYLLSGGLDSSLVCAIAARNSKEPITTFAIGIDDNPIDTHFARIVAKHIGSNHHEVLFTRKEMLDAIETIIHKLESFDITTVRASVGMHLLCKYIKEKTDIKVVLTGECSDELFGYKYTDFAPNPDEFQKEAEKRVKELYIYDVLRADRCIAGNSLEPRVPFSDTRFVQYVMGIKPELKMNTYNMGKYLLRKAFDFDDYLPTEILYRDKAAFSDAVGHAAVDTLKDVADKMYTSEELMQLKSTFSHAAPFTKEALWYRSIFEKYFSGHAKLIKDFWMPNKQWQGCDVKDPSARALSNYGDSGNSLSEMKTEKDSNIKRA